MKIATWNINSIRARADRVLAAMQRHNLDVLALQEIKCKAEQFPAELFEEAGYEVAAHGLNQWNGVAVLSRIGLDHVRTSFPRQPGFEKGEADSGFIDSGIPEARALGVSVGSGENAAEIWSLYVPNGRAIGDPHYFYKLEFLHKLCDYAADRLAENSRARLMLMGDWNVIPTDQDVWDPKALGSDLYMSEAERAAFYEFEKAGLQEVTRRHATNYTFWDYQKLRFPRNEGMRIDYAYASPALAEHVAAAHIDRDERKGKGASDHVPVIIDISE